MKKSVEAIYKGNVQGVGFRFAAAELAMEYSVKGYVENLQNGDVKVAAEGDEDAVNNFINELSSQMSRFILSSVINPQPYSGIYSSFKIKY